MILSNSRNYCLLVLSSTLTIILAISTPQQRNDERNFKNQCERGREFDLISHHYGKNNVKILYVDRITDLYHEINDLDINIQLTLGSEKDYICSDNSDSVPTDTQKNTVYILAREYGIKSPEEFGSLLCSHFLETYPQVSNVLITIEKNPWSRYLENGLEHNHGFVKTSAGTKLIEISQARGDVKQQIRAGIKDLAILKSTKSRYAGFVQDEFTILPYVDDRVMSTDVTAWWDYSSDNISDYKNLWGSVKDAILEKVFGPPETGVMSNSLQNTLYASATNVLKKFPQIDSIEFTMPNHHYTLFDFKKFEIENLERNENDNVFQPYDSPQGTIYGKLSRHEIDN